jgi:hypothetical protein
MRLGQFVKELNMLAVMIVLKAISIGWFIEMVRNQNTCNTCTVIEKVNGKIKVTLTSDSRCDCRATCADDGSSTDKREQPITEWGHLWEVKAVEGKSESL